MKVIIQSPENFALRFGKDADPATHSIGDMAVYLDNSRVPRKWRDLVVAHEKAELEAELELGLTSDAERDERLDVVLIAHSRALEVEYDLALTRSELGAYHDWVRRQYAEAIEDASENRDRQAFLRAMLAEREEVVRQARAEL